jgi:hypothetical protein
MVRALYKCSESATPNKRKTMSNPTSTAAAPTTGIVDFSHSVLVRYKDAYLLARAITGIGKSVKFVGVAIFVLLAVGGILVVIQTTAPGVPGEQRQWSASQLGFLGVPLGVIIGLPLYILGIIVAAQGELLKATLDTAVNGTPFLKDDQRASAMSLSGAQGVSDQAKPKWSWGW